MRIVKLLGLALPLALGVAAARGSAAASPSEASAKSHAVLVLPLEAEGVLATDRGALEQRLRDAFEHPDITVIRAAEAELCGDEACLRELGRERGASHVVHAKIIADGRDYISQLVVLAVEDDGPAHVIDAGCEICGLAEFDDRLAARAVAARELILAKPAVGELEIVGTPEDARVRIDGRRRGRLPYRAQLSVGRHELIVSAAGHFPEVVPVDALAGVAQRLEVELAPKPIASWRRPTGWALLGSGLASVVTGSILLGVHGSPASLRCTAAEPGLIDADGDCRWLRRTLGPGVGLTIAGVAVASAGASLLVIDARRRRAHEQSERRDTNGDSRPDAQISARVGLDHVELQIRF